MSQASSDRRVRLTALLLFLLALGIRLIGINWGLPNDLRNSTLHPDEPVVYWNYAYRPNPVLPGNYNYPTLYPLMVRVAGDVAATYGGINGPLGEPPPPTISGVKAYFTKYKPHLSAVVEGGRLLNCIAGAGTVLAVFFILLRFAGLTGAALGGALTAIAPLLVVHSRFATVDVMAAFFFWIAMLYAIKLYNDDGGQSAELKYALLAGLFAGLSAGTKYTGIIVLLSVFMALRLSNNRRLLPLLAASAGMAILAFVITTPGSILDWQAFRFGLAAEAQHMRQDQELTFVATPPGFIYHLGNLFTGIGPLAFVIGIAGLFYAAIQKRRWAWILIPTLLLYYVFIGMSQVKFARYAIPLVPAIACGFGYALAGALRRPNLRTAGLVIAAVALTGVESLIFAGYKPTAATQSFDPRFGGLWGTYRLTADMLREDPRDEAARYLKSKAASAPDMKVGIFWEPWFWTVPLVKDTDFLYNAPDQINARLTALYFASTDHPRVVYADLRNQPDYIVASSFELQPFERIRSDQDVPAPLRGKYYEYGDRLDQITKRCDLDRTFGGDAPAVDDLLYVQPKVEVFRVEGMSQ